MWDVEFTDEFYTWWESLSASEQDSLQASIELLEISGPSAGQAARGYGERVGVSEYEGASDAERWKSASHVLCV
jgi:hypothetical protein